MKLTNPLKCEISGCFILQWIQDDVVSIEENLLVFVL